MGKKFEEWSAEIKASPDNKKVIDMSKEFQALFARNIISIVLGEDIDSEIFTMKFRETPTSSNFVDKKTNMSAAIIECFEQLVQTFVSRFCNPLWLCGLIGLQHDFTSY